LNSDGCPDRHQRSEPCEHLDPVGWVSRSLVKFGDARPLDISLSTYAVPTVSSRIRPLWPVRLRGIIDHRAPRGICCTQPLQCLLCAIICFGKVISSPGLVLSIVVFCGDRRRATGKRNQFTPSPTGKEASNLSCGALKPRYSSRTKAPRVRSRRAAHGAKLFFPSTYWNYCPRCEPELRPSSFFQSRSNNDLLSAVPKFGFRHGPATIQVALHDGMMYFVVIQLRVNSPKRSSRMLHSSLDGHTFFFCL
jgi:hypothetical protein